MHETKSPRKKLLLAGLISSSILLVAFWGTAWIVGGQLIAPKPIEVGPPPTDLPATHFLLDSKSGATISGWHIQSASKKGVIVLVHGLRESRLSMLDRARFLYRAGYSILMIDLQAHGESTGEYISLGHLENHDVQAAISYAKEKHPLEPVAVLAKSLGGASTLLANQPLPADAIVLESVFPTLKQAVHNRVHNRLGFLSVIPANLLLIQLKPRCGFSASEIRPIDQIPNVECPIFLFSGKNDPHTTASETRMMFDAAAEPKELWLIEGAGHVDLHAFDSSEYEEKILRFLNQAFVN